MVLSRPWNNDIWNEFVLWGVETLTFTYYHVVLITMWKKRYKNVWNVRQSKLIIPKGGSVPNKCHFFNYGHSTQWCVCVGLHCNTQCIISQWDDVKCACVIFKLKCNTVVWNRNRRISLPFFSPTKRELQCPVSCVPMATGLRCRVYTHSNCRGNDAHHPHNGPFEFIKCLGVLLWHSVSAWDYKLRGGRFEANRQHIFCFLMKESLPRLLPST